MVQLFKFLLKSIKNRPAKRARGKFVDSLQLTVRGGHGGNGVPKYGGVGGQGGCVCFIAKEGISLSKLEKDLKENRICAASGEDGSKVRLLGRRGLDEIVPVPLGVQILNDKGKVLADLNEENAKYIVAGGGKGGCSQTGFIGKPGVHCTVSLDLKLIADVGLVGFPNAGKSTFLQAVSNAKPKIASYPFTTIQPQIGIVEYPDLRRITVADLPGLIEGAHANFGMGHKFLKHIERTRVLLMIVDIFGFRLSPLHKQRTCLENIYALNQELEMYDETLLHKPCVLIINKMDKAGANETFANIKNSIENLETGLQDCPESIRPTKVINLYKIIPISAMHSTRIDYVKKELRNALDELAEKELADNDKIREVLQRKLGERGPKIT